MMFSSLALKHKFIEKNVSYSVLLFIQDFISVDNFLMFEAFTVL